MDPKRLWAGLWGLARKQTIKCTGNYLEPLTLQVAIKAGCTSFLVLRLLFLSFDVLSLSSPPLFLNSLGLLSEEPVLQQKTPLDTLCLYLTDKLAYGEFNLFRETNRKILFLSTNSFATINRSLMSKVCAVQTFFVALLFCFCLFFLNIVF